VARGVDVRRTAMRLRNPENAPSAREVEILKSFAERIKAGEDMAKIEHAEIVGSGGDRTHVYMKPIPMASEPCATCHGTDIKPEIRERISQLYPKDQATGFSAGELRGAFVVKQPVK
jgi:hypothetical protein